MGSQPVSSSGNIQGGPGGDPIFFSKNVINRAFFFVLGIHIIFCQFGRVVIFLKRKCMLEELGELT